MVRCKLYVGETVNPAQWPWKGWDIATRLKTYTGEIYLPMDLGSMMGLSQYSMWGGHCHPSSYKMSNISMQAKHDLWTSGIGIRGSIHARNTEGMNLRVIGQKQRSCRGKWSKSSDVKISTPVKITWTWAQLVDRFMVCLSTPSHTQYDNQCPLESKFSRNQCGNSYVP